MKKNYTEAYEELQEIVSLLENAEISVDELSVNVKKATELIRICSDKLNATEKEVREIIQKMED